MSDRDKIGGRAEILFWAVMFECEGKKTLSREMSDGAQKQ